MKACKLIGTAVSLFFLTIVGAAQVPLLHQGLIPPSIAPGSSSFTLTVHGANFGSAAVVNWNGSPRLTEIISSNQLRATINAADVGKGQTANVTVTNPGAGGGTSNVVYFPVTRPLTSIGFAFSPMYLISFNTQGMVAGDFNGDGLLDLAYAEQNNNLHVSLGKGNGTFQGAISGGAMLTPVATGDFNNDGKLDLVGNGYGLAVALGTGNGTFSVTAILNSSTEYPNTAVADFNHDGKLDVIVPGYSGWQVYFGNGDGTFTAGAQNATEVEFSSFAVGDFNGDGYVDVAGLGYSKGLVLNVFLNNGDGTFHSSGMQYNAGGAVFAADMNNDGILDLVAGPPAVTFLGNGDGTFSTVGGYTVSSGPIAGTEDFTGDGILDVGTSIDPVVVLPGTGNGEFSTAWVFYPFVVGGGPGVVGDFNNDGHMDIIADQGNGTAEVAVQIPVTLQPNEMSFAAQNVGTTSFPQNVPFVNTGWGSITINSITVGGTNGASFAQTNNCPAVLQANATCNISVTFSPKKGGNLAGTLIVNYKGLGSSQTVSLTGTGLVPPTVSLTPAKMNFGVLVLGKSSAAQTATLTNTGNQSVSISSISTAAPFAQTNNCPSTLVVGGSCQIQVTFTPSAIGTSLGSLTVTDNAAKSPQTVALGGIGTIITVSPIGVNFGNQAVGTTSSAASVTVSNVGASAVTFGSIGMTGTNPSDFAQMNNCVPGLAPNTSCTIQVVFKPTATGARAASLTITDNGGGSPQKVSLTGTGT